MSTELVRATSSGGFSSSLVCSVDKHLFLSFLSHRIMSREFATPSFCE